MPPPVFACTCCVHISSCRSGGRCVSRSLFNTEMTCLRRLCVCVNSQAVGPRAEGVADKKEYDVMTQTATPFRISVRGFVSASARYACNLQLCLTPFARNSSKRNSILHFIERFVSVPQATLHPKRHQFFVEYTLTERLGEFLCAVIIVPVVQGERYNASGSYLPFF